MKKILIFAACVASLVACNNAQKPIELYCEHEVSQLYNDPNAEMDTLSYAAGMNIGLVVSLQNVDFDLDTEAIIAILQDELKIAYVDDKDLEEYNKFLDEYSNERVRPFMMAKQANARVVTDCPDTLKLPAYTADLAKKWFERVSTKDGVKAMVDENGAETGVYYRINNVGGNVKPVNATDSIAVKYAMYSRTGKLLESNQMFIDNLKKNREQVENNKMMPDSMRQKYIKQIDEEIAKSEIRELPLNRFMQADIQNALKLIGNGGSITIWMDAAKALGYRASRVLPINEAVVVNVDLLNVKTIEPAPQPATNHFTVPTNGNVKVAPQGKAAIQKPVIVPVQKK